MDQMIWDAIWISVLGFFSGSVLYAKLMPRLMCGVDICQISEDGNPGTANVFKYCGKKCGVIASILEFAKGFVPVAISHGLLGIDIRRGIFFFVMIAPVMGHIFSVFNHFRGGIGIAPFFGTLIAIYPFTQILVILVGSYVLGKYIIPFKNTKNRTFFVFVTFGIASFFLEQILTIKCVCSFVSAVIVDRKRKALAQQEILQVG